MSGITLPSPQSQNEQFLTTLPALSDDARTEMLNQLGSNASSSPAQEALMKEIQGLADAALDIDISFVTVASLLEKVKSQAWGAKAAIVEDVQGLIDVWQKDHKTYNKLLWESRKVAGKARAVANDFANDLVDFLADDEVPLEEKKAEIQSYMEKLSTDDAASQAMAEGFTEIITRIESFKEEWAKVIRKYDIDAISSRVQTLDDIISLLQDSLKELEKKAMRLGVTFTVLAGATVATGVSVALGLLCPAFWFVTLAGVAGSAISGACYLRAKSEREDILRALASNQTERATEIRSLGSVKKLSSTLGVLGNDFGVICSRLGSFAGVWAAIRADIQEILERLVIANDSRSNSLFKSRLRSIGKLYAALGRALYYYELAINKDGVLSSTALGDI